jgi:hypothetical protein
MSVRVDAASECWRPLVRVPCTWSLSGQAVPSRQGSAATGSGTGNGNAMHVPAVVWYNALAAALPLAAWLTRCRQESSRHPFSAAHGVSPGATGG